MMKAPITVCYDAEMDMYTVYDYALLLNDYLTRAERLSEEQQASLSLISGQLMSIGERLRERHGELHQALTAARAA